VRFYSIGPSWAIWDSHRAVAQDAIAKGFACILVLEDDVLFTRPRETLVRRITAYPERTGIRTRTELCVPKTSSVLI
jgi:GR25 family glycosyltransferase involved in LPS biosynthesis